MHIVLRPMTEDTYQTYLREHEEEYARDRMITDRENFEDALRTTCAQLAALLPQGGSIIYIQGPSENSAAKFNSCVTTTTV